MESWRTIWREILANELPTAGLEALATALEEDRQTLVQGRTVSWVECGAGRMLIGACGIGYPFWAESHNVRPSEIELMFSRICMIVDAFYGDPGRCRFWINWFDQTDRLQMRAAVAV